MMKVLVCGLNYGLNYVHAAMALESVEVVGALTRGSDRSRALARRYDLPLYTELATAIHRTRPDAAVLAVPPSQLRPLGESLLAAGVHILCEHPVDATVLARLQRAAAEHGLIADVAEHFSSVEPPRLFLHNAMAHGLPLFAQMTFHSRLTWSTAELLSLAFASRPTLDVALLGPPMLASDGHYRVLPLRLASSPVPVTGLAYAPMDRVVDRADKPVRHRMSFVYPWGSLILGDTFGPFQTLGAAYGSAPAPDLHCDASTGDAVGALRRAANRRILEQLVARVDEPGSTREARRRRQHWIAELDHALQRTIGEALAAAVGR